MSISFLDPKVNPFQTSEIRRIQEFYWISYEDLSSVEKMKSFWLKQWEIDYCLENKDKEFALKSTEWFELRDWVLNTERFKKLQEYYGFTLQDTQSIEVLKTYWLTDDDIDYITWRDLQVKKETTSINTKEDIKQPQSITKKKLWKRK